MKKFVKIVLLVVAVPVALVIAMLLYAYGDMQRLRAARNPCERDCLQDSGGIVGCREYCASHPLTYGPAVPLAPAVSAAVAPAK